MNRVVTTLLSVLIVLVAANGALVWRTDERAHDDAERARDDARRQSCIDRAQATAMIAILTPAVVSSSDKETRDNRIRGLQTLSNQLDDC